MPIEPWLARLIEHVRRERAAPTPEEKPAEKAEGLLPPGCACPRCHERLADALAWDEAGERVTCTTCGHSWDPNA